MHVEFVRGVLDVRCSEMPPKVQCLTFGVQFILSEVLFSEIHVQHKIYVCLFIFPI